ncbi:Hypothetical protein ORPV_1153 [Orpheovirus IHUMI-LCC2]|uniref:Uncharacterized protein n=1 Tax=Orpheovirus IHUMI-LCC2 TaxID=2023057 RepID=A0A2I2L6A2_9VIRU|nr:Hypothetical protein ORPV_1153 [Orpheovirus IHUMI-LCC2]SNW63057.1 Hypothetical protein ORPV_1153 [Orpheovirus IHUMI-LCC2]
MENNKLLVLHVDINGTIVGFDSTDPNASIREAAAESFARSINLDGSFNRPGQESYYEFAKKSNPKGYKEEVYKFLEKYPEHKDTYERVVKVFEGGLFPSFHKLVREYVCENGARKKAVLVLRTFGKDGRWVTEELYDRHGMLMEEDTPEELTYQTISGIMLLLQTQNILTVDDYKRWDSNGRLPKYGKVIKGHPNLIQYGFDDNDCMYGIGEGVYINKVNTVEAALDEDYFVKLLPK